MLSSQNHGRQDHDNSRTCQPRLYQDASFIKSEPSNPKTFTRHEDESDEVKTSTTRLTSAGLLLILVVSSFLLSGAVSSLNTPVAIGPGRRFIDLVGNYTEAGAGGRSGVKTQGSFAGLSGILPLSRVTVRIR